MFHKKFYSPQFLFSLSCALCFYFLATLGIDYPHSTPWDFIALMENIGFISFVSNYPPEFFMILSIILLLTSVIIIFLFTYWLQKILNHKKIISTSISVFGIGIILSFMFTATLLHGYISNYYHQGINDGQIQAHLNIFDILSVEFEDKKRSCPGGETKTLLIDKAMRTLEVIEINEVKTIQICTTTY